MPGPCRSCRALIISQDRVNCNCQHSLQHRPAQAEAEAAGADPGSARWQTLNRFSDMTTIRGRKNTWGSVPPSPWCVRCCPTNPFSDSFRGQSLRASGSAHIFAWSSRFQPCCAHLPSDRLFQPHAKIWLSLTVPKSLAEQAFQNGIGPGTLGIRSARELYLPSLHGQNAAPAALTALPPYLIPVSTRALCISLSKRLTFTSIPER